MTELDDLDDDAPELRQALADIVSTVSVTPDLRARVAQSLRSRPTTWAGVPLRRVVAAAAVLALLAGGAALVAAQDEREQVATVADDPDPTPTTPPPTVAGIVIERPEGDGSASTTTTAPTAAPPVVPASPEATTATTALVCRNSTDPACGDFFWDPEPIVGQSTVRLDVPGGPLQVGVPYDIVVELTDPTAPPTFNCGIVDVSPMAGESWVGGFTCVVEPAPWCTARYGPWTPPAPNGGTVTERVPVTFDEPGTYTISVQTRTPAKHCYQPYGSDAATSITVDVSA